jgi:hypothetical protein
MRRLHKGGISFPYRCRSGKKSGETTRHRRGLVAKTGDPAKKKAYSVATFPELTTLLDGGALLVFRLLGEGWDLNQRGYQT